MRFEIDVFVRRGSITESRHRIQAAVCDPDGALIAGTGDPDRMTSFRSSAKPFQLLPLVERGHAERFGFGDEQLAVMAASHTGSPDHLNLVRGLLERLGCTADNLACGYHDPLDAESLARLRAHPDERSRLYNNCSGKHAGMLALCRAEGWPLAGYATETHPVQQLMRRTVAECAGLAPEALLVAVDGCSVSVFGLPLSAMARAYARLAAADPGAATPRERALARIRGAMTGHPQVVGGAGIFDSALMQASGGRLLVKVGAEGLECVAIPGRALGVAVKAEDGHIRAATPATVAVLEQLGELSARELETLAEARRATLTNTAGQVVGHVEAVVLASAATA